MEDYGSLTRHQLLSCLELGKALTAELDATRLLDTILHKVSALLPAEHWSLLLLDEATGELHFELSVDLGPSLLHGLRLRPVAPACWLSPTTPCSRSKGGGRTPWG